MQSVRAASRRVAGAASRSAFRSTAQTQAWRRAYASSSGSHGKPKSSEVTWAMGAVAITIPGLYFALQPSADAGHHGDHDDHGHDEHGSDDKHDEQESGDDAGKDEESSGDPKDDAGSDDATAESNDDDTKESNGGADSEDAGDKKEDDKDKDEGKDEDGDDSNNGKKDDSKGGKDPRKSEKTNDNPTSDAAHPRMHEPQLSNKKESGLPATVKEKKGHDGRL